MYSEGYSFSAFIKMCAQARAYGKVCQVGLIVMSLSYRII